MVLLQNSTTNTISTGIAPYTDNYINESRAKSKAKSQWLLPPPSVNSAECNRASEPADVALSPWLPVLLLTSVPAWILLRCCWPLLAQRVAASTASPPASPVG
jgi:hypothetical protein